MSEKKYYLIFGAQMVNKGAQAMLFVTASEIRKRDPQAEIVVFIYDKWKAEEDPSVYNFRFVPITMKEIMNLSRTSFSRAYLLAKKAKMKPDSPRLQEIREVLEHSKMAFDISGYALSNQWGVNGSLFYLSKFALLHQYDIPTYILPQSFGPFDYHSAAKNMIVHRMTKKYLSYPEIIFAREQEGFDALTKEMKLSNVRLSSDLVLQSAVVDRAAIYNGTPDIRTFPVSQGHCVAIIPNSSNNKHGNGEQLLKLYGQLIEKLTAMDKEIYLLAHSSQDMDVCRAIQKQSGEQKNLHLMEADLNCIEYGLFIRQFDYVIASRFHSIVNAFKEHIPCIALGWAVKYEDLLDLLGQKQFNHDVRTLNDFEPVFASLEKMEASYGEQSALIEEKLTKIQKESCFLFLDDVI